jgi:hypothetical protein
MYTKELLDGCRRAAVPVLFIPGLTRQIVKKKTPAINPIKPDMISAV